MAIPHPAMRIELQAVLFNRGVIKWIVKQMFVFWCGLARYVPNIYGIDVHGLDVALNGQLCVLLMVVYMEDGVMLAWVLGGIALVFNPYFFHEIALLLLNCEELSKNYRCSLQFDASNHLLEFFTASQSSCVGAAL